MLIYLHGFRSGPQSHKAQSLAQRMRERGLAAQWWCEQLQWGPARAIAQISAVIEASPTTPTLVGSSLGGFYATHLAEQFGLRAVVVNPAVISPISLAPYMGEQSMIYTGETFSFTQAHLEELRSMQHSTLRDPDRYWLLAETGDEVLDYRDAERFYQGARQTILDGGDHSFTRWPDYLDSIIDLACPAN